MLRIKNLGVGTDIESIDRFRALDLENDKAFFDKVFTKKELDYSFSKKKPAHHLAARYVGKEAVIKALNSIGRENLDFKKVEISNNESGAPVAKINDAAYSNLKVYISLSHCEDKAIAFAIVMENE